MMKFVELFAGIGMARMGLEKAGMKCVHACESDKHKRREYEIIHGNLPESEDIRNLRAVDIPKSELWFFGAPCQDFSIAGLRQGLNGERSSLIREVFRLLEEKGEDKPDWIVYENVKGMLSSNGGWDYFSILYKMDELGYDVEWQTLNTKDFGVPQNRERVYTVGHLRRIGERQILPITKTNGKNSDLQIKVVGTKNPNKKIQQRKMIYSDSGLVGCLAATDYKEPKIIQIGKFKNSKRENPDVYRVFDTKGIAPCLTTMQGGRREPFIKVKSNTKKGYEQATFGDSINISYPESKTRRGKVGKKVAQTLTTSCNQACIVKPCLTPNRINKRQNGRRFKDDVAPMFTITPKMSMTY